MQRFLTPADVAKKLGISKTTVLFLMKDGRIPYVKVSKRTYRIPEETLEEWLISEIEKRGE